VTIFSRMFTIACCLISSRVRVNRIRVRIRLGVWLVSCYAHVFVPQGWPEILAIFVRLYFIKSID